MLVCGVAHAQDVAPPPSAPAPEDGGITINLDAVPVAPPKAVAKPVRPLSLVRPRPKPQPDVPAASGTDAEHVTGTLAIPPEKAASDVAALAPAPPAKPAPAQPRPAVVATPPAQPQVPVTIVSSNTKAFPVEITGVAADPFAGAKDVNPLAGFLVLSRVRFVNGKADITAQAQAVLDALAQRLAATHDRVRLAAFSGQAGDLSSDARRLSLARALAIRNYLGAKGVPMERVDVLAFGGATDGVTDRVDVLVRGT
jgi:outer membrane protein OmpA-like peptidoglycan-associated protein